MRKSFGILQRDLLGHRQRHRGLGQFAVTQLAAIRAQHRAGLRAQGGDVHLPARCGGTEQHGPCARAELAILRKTVLDRIGTAGEVNAEARVDVGTVVRAMPAAHQAPVGVEFFSQDHRQCGLHALSELQPVDRHRDFAIGGDLHEGRRLLGRLERAGRLGRQPEPLPGEERRRAPGRRRRPVSGSCGAAASWLRPSDCAPSGAAAARGSSR